MLTEYQARTLRRAIADYTRAEAEVYAAKSKSPKARGQALLDSINARKRLHELIKRFTKKQEIRYVRIKNDP